MLKKEKRYEFRKRLLNIHKKDIRDFSSVPGNDELVFKDGLKIVIPENSSEVTLTAVNDFVQYMFISMNMSVMISKKNEPLDNAVICSIAESQTEDYIIKTDYCVRIYAKNERSLAQAFYCLEDKMTLRKAPFIKKEDIKHTFLFSPRMVHSGFGFDNYPNEHLASIAHAGMDAILVFVKGVNQTPAGFMDFNELIYRASRYGLDVYAYSYLKSEMHPEDEGAQEFYDNLYGSIFKACPGFKGVILVGESVGFPSKDEHVNAKGGSVDEDGFPTGKPAPGWWPCYDYPEWLECVKKSIRSIKADADIVFWTYNWGYVNTEDRIKLINSLPTDITLMATFEMFETYDVEDIKEFTADYTLALPGPGKYFSSEAEAAKKRGIKLYTMSNTGGTTWDMGTVPYEPMPYQWMKRYEALRKANEDWGLSGLMESHHYGYWPSFIGDLAKQCFIKENTDMEKALSDVISARYGAEDSAVICDALKYWSEAITYYTPSDADQYGAFRIGPSYPLCLIKEMKPKSESFAHFGNEIVFTIYPADYHSTNTLPTGRGMVPYVRIDAEIRSLKKMYELMRKGTDILKEIKNKNEELEYLVNLGEFICCYVTTGLNAKKWYRLSSKLKSESDVGEVARLSCEMEELLKEERENAESAIEFTEKDSRLGWEPSMDYLGDAEHIRWKLKHLEYVLGFELNCYRKNSGL